MPKIASCIIEIVVFRFENDKPEYLLLHRHRNESLYPGIWQIISGSIEHDEKALDAALRELNEETQFKPKSFWIVPHITQFYDPVSDVLNLCTVFAAQVEPGSNPSLSDEHDDYRWLTFDEAIKLPVWHGQKEAVRITHEYIVGGKEAMKLNDVKILS